MVYFVKILIGKFFQLFGSRPKCKVDQTAGATMKSHLLFNKLGNKASIVNIKRGSGNLISKSCVSHKINSTVFHIYTQQLCTEVA